MMLLTEGVEKVFIHHLRSTWHIPAGIEAYFGIINRDMSWKPAAHAFAAFTKQMPAYSTRPVLTKKGDCYRADWRRPDGKKCAAFWRESTRTENLPLEIKGKCVITNYLGVEEQVLPNGGKMDLSVGPGIVYLQYENAVNW